MPKGEIARGRAGMDLRPEHRKHADRAEALDTTANGAAIVEAVLAVYTLLEERLEQTSIGLDNDHTA